MYHENSFFSPFYILKCVVFTFEIFDELKKKKCVLAFSVNAFDKEKWLGKDQRLPLACVVF